MAVRIHGRTAVPRRRVLLPGWVLRSALAISGGLMAAFVLVHMVGNLKLLAGRAQMDAYAQWLREVGEPALPQGSVLWALRVVLLLCVLVHVLAALVLWRRGVVTGTPGTRGVRPQAWGARLMMPTGVLILTFVVLHLLDLTLGWGVQSPDFRHPDPDVHAAANVVGSLGRPAMAVLYLVVLVALAVHLSHGIHLAWQDLGGAAPRSRGVARVVAHVVAVAVLFGDGAVVVASWAGVV